MGEGVLVVEDLELEDELLEEVLDLLAVDVRAVDQAFVLGLVRAALDHVGGVGGGVAVVVGGVEHVASVQEGARGGGGAVRGRSGRVVTLGHLIWIKINAQKLNMVLKSAKNRGPSKSSYFLAIIVQLSVYWLCLSPLMAIPNFPP